MLMAKVFNTDFRYFLRWDLFIDRAPAFSQHVLQAHSRMLCICVSGPDVWV